MPRETMQVNKAGAGKLGAGVDPRRAPAVITPSRLDDIVDEIVDNLCRLRMDREQAEAGVRRLIADMRADLKWFKAIPTSSKTKTLARKIERWWSSLIEQLPPGERDVLLKHAYTCRLPQALDATVKVLKSRRGLSGHVDRVNILCVNRAYDLIGQFSRRKPSGTEHGNLRTIASLLCEALSGYGGADLKRACDNVLRMRKQRP